MPAVMWIHGGGWSSGSHYDMQQAVLLATHGYVVLSVDYRLVDEAIWPAQIEDCKLGIRWLREHAATYNVNPDRIGCWGASAGGHLAALMGVTFVAPPGSPPAQPSPAEVDAAVLNFLDANLKK